MFVCTTSVQFMVMKKTEVEVKKKYEFSRLSVLECLRRNNFFFFGKVFWSEHFELSSADQTKALACVQKAVDAPSQSHSFTTLDRIIQPEGLGQSKFRIRCSSVRIEVLFTEKLEGGGSAETYVHFGLKNGLVTLGTRLNVPGPSQSPGLFGFVSTSLFNSRLVKASNEIRSDLDRWSEQIGRLLGQTRSVTSVGEMAIRQDKTARVVTKCLKPPTHSLRFKIPDSVWQSPEPELMVLCAAHAAEAVKKIDDKSAEMRDYLSKGNFRDEVFDCKVVAAPFSDEESLFLNELARESERGQESNMFSRCQHSKFLDTLLEYWKKNWQLELESGLVDQSTLAYFRKESF